MKNYRRVAWLILLGMGVLFLDFLSKGYVLYVLPFYDTCVGRCLSFPVFQNFLGIDFAITLTTNRGAAWGMFANFQMLLLIVRIVVIGALLCYLFFFNKKRAMEPPFVLIIAGALGNIVDFFLYGFVVDFLSFNFWGYPFPVFNVADTSITIGVVWLIGLALFKRKGDYAQSL